MRFARALSASLLMALAAPAPGCIVATDDTPLPPPPPASGTLTVAYTIEGTTDPVLCDHYNVSDAELVVYYSVGRDRGTEVTAPCYGFEVSARLSPGLYDADVTLVDQWDKARSVTKPLESLRVVAGTELVVDVDFTRESML